MILIIAIILCAIYAAIDGAPGMAALLLVLAVGSLLVGMSDDRGAL